MLFRIETRFARSSDERPAAIVTFTIGLALLTAGWAKADTRPGVVIEGARLVWFTPAFCFVQSICGERFLEVTTVNRSGKGLDQIEISCLYSRQQKLMSEMRHVLRIVFPGKSPPTLIRGAPSEADEVSCKVAGASAK